MNREKRYAEMRTEALVGKYVRLSTAHKELWRRRRAEVIRQQETSVKTTGFYGRGELEQFPNFIAELQGFLTKTGELYQMDTPSRAGSRPGRRT